MNQKIRLLAVVSFAIFSFSCSNKPEKIDDKVTAGLDPQKETAMKEHLEEINILLDSLNISAAKADFNEYFRFFTENATYNGTDATENWTKQTFMEWAKPYFEAKTTWNFKSIKRNVYFGDHQDIAWFDELLSTQMKICRGSGVVVKKDNKWKIQQYVLSMTIPNSQLDKVIATKSAVEDSLLNGFKK